MQISHRTAGSVTVLNVTGRLTAGHDVTRLRHAASDAVNAGCRELIVNLCGLTHLDARGLGEIASTIETVLVGGGRLTLVAASPRVARLLAVTHLDTVCEWSGAELELAT